METEREPSLPEGIVLCGIKHAGKSVCAAEIAGILGAAYADTDDLLVREYQKRTGTEKQIREIYSLLGEEGFRKLEASVIRALGTGTKRVIALGGGVLTNPFLTVDDIRRLGWLVFLDVTDETAFARIQREGLPPFLQKEADPFASFCRDNEKRRTVMRAAADDTVKRGDDTVRETALRIIAGYREKLR